ncbi:MAG: translational GTPase TypA, partial [Chloroflexi bacterium]|nr:translational GTPase TypA [Chloroflexota bacterium]
YALDTAQERGALFIGPGVRVYEGMVIGENVRPGDIAINVCKTKHLTGHRRSFAEEAIRLTPPRELSLDQCIEFLADDELLEVTPENLRLRKRILDNDVRIKEQKRRRELEGA